MDNLAQKKKCSPQQVAIRLSAVVDGELRNDAAPPVPPHTKASSELFQNGTNEELYPSTGQIQTQRQNEVAYLSTVHIA